MSLSDDKLPFVVTLTYFKDSGKLYASEEVTRNVRYNKAEGDRGPAYTPYLEDVCAWVRGLRDSGQALPGLTSAWADGYVLVANKITSNRDGLGTPRLLLPVKQEVPLA